MSVPVGRSTVSMSRDCHLLGAQDDATERHGANVMTDWRAR